MANTLSSIGGSLSAQMVGLLTYQNVSIIVYIVLAYCLTSFWSYKQYVPHGVIVLIQTNWNVTERGKAKLP